MKAFHLIFLLPMIVLIILILGAFIPMWLINPGVDQYTGEERTFARFALKQLDLIGPVGPVTARRVRVEKVREIDDGDCAPDPFNVIHQYRAEVKLYSLFGLSYGKLVVDCSSDRSAMLRVVRYW